MLPPMDLHQHFNAVISSNDKRYEQRFLAQEKAIAVAEYNSEKWRANANEWRSAMDDREVKFLTKAEFEAQHASVLDRIYKLELAKSAQEGKKDGFISGWGLIVTFVGLVLTGLSIFGWFYK